MPLVDQSGLIAGRTMKRGNSGRVAALQKLQVVVRKLQLLRSDLCHPITFRATNRPKPGVEEGTAPPPRLADYGSVRFAGRTQQQPAQFMHLAESRVPFRTPDEYACSIIEMMERHWSLGKASVIISITGGALDFAMAPRLQKAFSHGLAKAAQATSAWVFTGGTDSGVMQLVGRALAEYDARVAVVGVAAWGVVYGRERLEGSQDDVVELPRDRENSIHGTNLEPNHTHFVLPDNGASGSKAWGSEIQFRFILEREYAARRKVPRVLVVVQGGPGTLQSIYEAIFGECPVVLVQVMAAYHRHFWRHHLARDR